MGSMERALARKAHGSKYKAVIRAWREAGMASCDRFGRPPVPGVMRPVYSLASVEEAAKLPWWKLLVKHRGGEKT